ncbi:MAG: sensor histidine kinase [Salinivirgaceae bacterium]|nr:sensor histidine kinase [Salinivirgaceae bacterium]
MTKIRYKIGAGNVLISIVIATIVGVVSIWSSKRIISTEAESKLMCMVRAYGLDFEQCMTPLHNLSSALEAVVLGNINEYPVINDTFPIDAYKTRIIPVIEKLLQTFKPLTCWIIFDPDLAVGRHTISYEDIDNDGVYEREPEYSIHDFDLNDSTMRWWVDAIKYGETWSKPYFWENWKVELISYSRKVEVDGKVIACVGSDFDFQLLRKKLADANVYNTGYMVLMDENQELIIHPSFGGKKISEVLDSATYSQISSLFETENEGKFYYKINGVEKVTAFYKLSNRWSLVVIVEVDDIFSNSNRIIDTIAIIIVIGFVLSILIAYFLSTSLTRPIHELINQFRLGVAGDLNIRANQSKVEEINELATYFNRFMETIQFQVEELKKSEQELIEAKSKAEESDKLKSAFLANISHEVRTPLNAIIGFSQIIVQENSNYEMRQKYLQYITGSSERLTNIVDDIMIFSQIEQGQIKIKSSQININTFLDSIYADYQLRCAENSADIDFTLEKSLKDKTIKTDLVNLQRVFYILLSNAWKFTYKGQISFGYRLNAKDEFQFFVTDTGLGIPEKELNKVFLKFYKYQPSNIKFFDGTGLGLAIAKDLINLMGGNIWIDSSVGFGTKVYFNIKSED